MPNIFEYLTHANPGRNSRFFSTPWRKFSIFVLPEVKSWIDNVIVPTLVREYLASEQKRSEALQFDAPVVLCSDTKDSREGG